MNLLERIEAGMKESLKSGDKDRLETLKMLKSDMMYEKGKTGQDLTDEQMQESVMRASKKRKESMKAAVPNRRPGSPGSKRRRRLPTLQFPRPNREWVPKRLKPC